jgi:diphthine-ammonia ligase
VLFSGGKDSTFAILKAREEGHLVACLINLKPHSDESMLFHYPNNGLVRYQAEAMEIPLIEGTIIDNSITAEAEALVGCLKKAVSKYEIEGVVHGGIASNFQKQAFEMACNECNIRAMSPLWHTNPLAYMCELLARGFEIVIVSVSAMGLDRNWLGRKLDHASINMLAKLSEKFGFNLNFEGGEAETLVIDCPLFKKKLAIQRAVVSWDGQRGIFEIQEAALVDKEQIDNV